MRPGGELERGGGLIEKLPVLTASWKRAPAAELPPLIIADLSAAFFRDAEQFRRLTSDALS